MCTEQHICGQLGGWLLIVLFTPFSWVACSVGSTFKKSIACISTCKGFSIKVLYKYKLFSPTLQQYCLNKDMLRFAHVLPRTGEWTESQSVSQSDRPSWLGASQCGITEQPLPTRETRPPHRRQSKADSDGHLMSIKDSNPPPIPGNSLLRGNTQLNLKV